MPEGFTVSRGERPGRPGAPGVARNMLDLSTSWLGLRLRSPFVPGREPAMPRRKASPLANVFSVDAELYLAQHDKLNKCVDLPIVASLKGTTPGGWNSYAKRLESAGAEAFELNLYEIATSPDERRRRRAATARGGPLGGPNHELLDVDRLGEHEMDGEDRERQPEKDHVLRSYGRGQRGGPRPARRARLSTSFDGTAGSIRAVSKREILQ